jgi:hypothetical protein
VPYRNRLLVRDHSDNVAISIAFINLTHLSLSGDLFYKNNRITYHTKIGLREIEIYVPSGDRLTGFENDCFYNHKLNLTEYGAAWMTDTGVSLILKNEGAGGPLNSKGRRSLAKART